MDTMDEGRDCVPREREKLSDDIVVSDHSAPENARTQNECSTSASRIQAEDKDANWLIAQDLTHIKLRDCAQKTTCSAPHNDARSAFLQGSLLNESISGHESFIVPSPPPLRPPRNFGGPLVLGTGHITAKSHSPGNSSIHDRFCFLNND